MQARSIRCIHVEGSGCYGHNGADDVALDAALLARGVPGRPVRRAMDARRRIRLGAVRPRHDDEGRGAVDATAASSTGSYEVWSNTHSTRPGEPGGAICWPAWYLANPQQPAPPRDMPAAGGRQRPQRDPALRLPAPAGGAPPDHGDAAARRRRCARSAPTLTCSRSSRSWTSWRARPVPTRSHFASPISTIRARRR